MGWLQRLPRFCRAGACFVAREAQRGEKILPLPLRSSPATLRCNPRAARRLPWANPTCLETLKGHGEIRPLVPVWAAGSRYASSWPLPP